MSTLWDQTLNTFCGETASSKPTPGGGSVTAVCGSLGISLIIMALEISKKNSQSLQAIETTLLDAHALLGKIKAHADEDIFVFELYMKALKLPKITPIEIDSRKLAIIEAAEKATDSPLASGRDMVSALELGVVASDLVKINVLSDVGAGSDLLGGTIAGTLRNVDINLSQLGFASAQRATAIRDELAARSRQLTGEINRIIHKRMSPTL